MEAPESKPENQFRTQRRRFGVLAVLVGLLPVLLLEIALRILGVGGNTHDPYTEFGGEVPVFEREGDVWRTAKAREPFLAPQSFAVEKPGDGFRIFCFGGSTVHGRPYQVDTAFPKWLELELKHRVPGRTYEVINCGGISYASYRIVPMVREIIAYEPDVIVLATGHNEFLEDRTYHQLKQRSWLRKRLDGLRVVSVGRNLLRVERKPAAEAVEGGFKTRLDNLNGYASYHRDPDWHERVVGQFRDSLREIVRVCDEAGVPLIIVQLGSNLRDCPPFKSEHRSDLSPEREQTWQRLFEQGSSAESADLVSSRIAYDEALEIDSGFALLNYRIAKVWDRIERADRMVAHYLAAKDTDVCPLRMLDAQRLHLELLASEHGLILVNADEVIASLCPEGVPGFDWYLDHVHPTIGGHQKIAQEIFAKMKETGQVTTTADWTVEQRASTYERHFKSLGARYLRDGARRLEWLDNWARREKLAAEVEPRNWADHVRLGIRRLDFGADEDALKSFEEALRLGADKARQRMEAHVLELKFQGRAGASEVLRNWLRGQ